MRSYRRVTGSEVAVLQPASVAVPDADRTVSQRVLDRIEDSKAENTRRAYKSDWRMFEKWCGQHGRTALPATPETLAAFASDRADLGKAPASIMRALASIRMYHEYAGHRPLPDTKLAQDVIKAYRKERAGKGLPNEKPAAALSAEHLKKISRTLDTGDVMGIRDRLVLVLGWAMMARRSELIGLDIADVTERDEGLDVFVRKSKTDQLAEGHFVAVPYGSDTDTCPVRLLRAWLALLASRGITDGPLFRRIDAQGRIGGEPNYGKGISGRVAANLRLSLPAIGIILRRAALAAGVPTKDLSPHSLRAGGATAAYLGGADLLEIGRHGGWNDQSAVLARYIRGVDRWERNPMHKAGL